MKQNILLALFAAGMALLCACGGEPEPAQPESEGEPMEIAAFSFYHTASWTGDCYCLELKREADGVHLYAEVLFSGGRIADAAIPDDVLKQVEELAGTYRVERWDGFDKSSKHVMDGSSFELYITLADGSTLSARGNNKFPEGYSEVSSAIRTLYNELMEQHGREVDEGGSA